MILAISNSQFKIQLQQHSKEGMQKVEYKCPSNKEAHFLCAEPRCAEIAVKCISSNSCAPCKGNHSRCPRESRIDKIIEMAQERAKQSPIIVHQINDEDLIKKLIDQLTAIRNEYKGLDVRSWGLDASISDLIFNNDMRGKKGREIAYLIDKDIVFPNYRFYRPALFRRDVQQVETINRQLEGRMIKMHKAYRGLAECDVLLQQYDKLKTEVAGLDLFKILSLQKLNELHLKLKQSIEEMLQLSRTFAGIEQQPSQLDTENFKDIGDRIYHLTYYIIRILYKQNKLSIVLMCILLNEDLFNESRKEYRLQMNQTYLGHQPFIKQCKAYAMYEQKKYQEAFDYFSSIEDSSLTIKILEMLIDMCHHLRMQPSTRVKYLLLFIRKLETEMLKQGVSSQQKQDMFDRKVTLLKQVIECYTLMGSGDEIYSYKKILNSLFYDRTKGLSKDDFLAFLEREYDCLEWEELHKNSLVFISVGNILKAAQTYPPPLDARAFQIQLKARYKSILLHRHQRSSYQKITENASEAVYKYLSDSEKKNKKFTQAQMSMIKEYLMRFLVFHGQCTKNQSIQLENAEKAVKLCKELGIKFFEPYFILAVSSFELNNENALRYQIEANDIYPTSVCYFNTAYLQYKVAMKSKGDNRVSLKQCLKSIQKSLSLKPDQLMLFHLQGIVYQNLGDFKLSNSNFKLAQASNDPKLQFDIKRRMAQNYQYLAKMNRNNPPSQEDLELLRKGEKLYRECLASQECTDNQSIIFGLGRTLFFQKKLAEAEQYFVQLKGTSMESDSYMYRGNIKEEQAKADDDRDFELLEQALNLYLLAGRRRENKENVVRIYKELDQQRKAEEVAQENWADK